MPTTVIPARYRALSLVEYFDSRLGTPPQTTVSAALQFIGGGSNIFVRNSNPSWKIQVAKRTNASTPYSRVSWSLTKIKPRVIQIETKDSGLTASYKVSAYGKAFDASSSLNLPALTDSQMIDAALAKVKRKLREQSSEAQAMVPVAELRELHRLVRQLADFSHEFLRSVRDLRRLRTRRAIRLLKSTYLGWNFGISPMVRDIRLIGNAIAAHLARQDLIVKLSGTEKKRVIFNPRPNVATAVPPGTTVTPSGFGFYDLSYQFVGAYNLKLKSAVDYTVFDRLGINLESVPYALWELTAFSWIADYFSNIGDSLEDRFYSPPGNLIYLTLSRRAVVNIDLAFDPSVPPANPLNYELNGKQIGIASIQGLEFDRTVYSTLPHVGLNFRTQAGTSLHAVSKVLNLLAVMR